MPCKVESAVHGLPQNGYTKGVPRIINYTRPELYIFCKGEIVEHIISLYCSSLDNVSKSFMGSHCLPWVHWCWNPDWEVLQGVAGESHRHLDHHPPHRRPGLPQGDHLSSKGLQHSPLPRSCESWHWKSL